MTTDTKQVILKDISTGAYLHPITNWGNISGTLSDQTDLQNALNNKQAVGNYVTIDTAQNIDGEKTFVGEKRIKFKQGKSGDKLGFTLYDYNSVEKGYLEFNPKNKIDNAPLMTLGNYTTTASGVTHVGFRKYDEANSGAYNLLAPLVSKAKTPFSLTTTYKNFYIPLGFTDGTTTVLTADSGLVNISTLLPADTKNTAGATDTSSKIFLVGATSQTANPQTYSQDTAFVDADGMLNSATPATSIDPTVAANKTKVTTVEHEMSMISSICALLDAETALESTNYTGGSAGSYKPYHLDKSYSNGANWNPVVAV